jgi:hypothetical protein
MMKLNYLHTFTDRHGGRRYYARINGVRHPLPDPGSLSVPNDEFMQQYRAAVGDKIPGGKRSIELRTGTIYVVGFANYVKIGFTTGILKRRLLRAWRLGARKTSRFFCRSRGPSERKHISTNSLLLIGCAGSGSTALARSPNG